MTENMSKIICMSTVHNYCVHYMHANSYVRRVSNSVQKKSYGHKIATVQTSYTCHLVYYTHGDEVTFTHSFIKVPLKMDPKLLQY